MSLQLMSRQMFGLGLMVLAVLVGLVHGTAHAQMFKVLPLQQPTGAVSSRPNKISPNGRWVAGNYTDANGVLNGVVWHDLAVAYTVAASGEATSADVSDVNDSGVAVGNQYGGGGRLGFVANVTGTQALGGFPGYPNFSGARAINNNGMIVGWAINGGYRDSTYSAAWQYGPTIAGPGNIHAAAGFGDAWFATEASVGEVVTESGMVLGSHGFASYSGTYFLNQDKSYVRGFPDPPINAGVYIHFVEASYHADLGVGFKYAITSDILNYLYTNSDEAFLNGTCDGTLTSLDIAPKGVTDQGVVVGTTSTNCFLRDINGSYTKIDDLIALDYRSMVSELKYVSNITNDRLMAVQDASGFSFVLQPVPEPSTYAMALAGLFCGGFTMWRRRR